MQALARLEQNLKNAAYLVSAVNSLIASVIEPDEYMAKLLRNVRMNQQLKMDNMVAQADKNNPIDIGEEYITNADSLMSSFTPEEALRRTQSKKLARKLYGIFHPDNGTFSGDTWMGRRMFDVVREAAMTGNLLMLNFISVKYSKGLLEEGVTLDGIADLAEARYQKLHGTPIVVCARLHQSSSPQTAAKTKRVLEELVVKTSVVLAR